MRNFFINSMNIVVPIFVVLGVIGILVTAIGAFISGEQFAAGAGILILIFGPLYLLLLFGLVYLQMGIQANTKRTAELLEQLVLKS
ncbi:MAG: hypothetical protein AAF914_13630 [Pseudomonadota bacterium]